VIDFSAPKDRIHSVQVGGEAVNPAYSDDHFIIPAAATRAGDNVITIEFTAGDEALNRKRRLSLQPCSCRLVHI